MFIMQLSEAFSWFPIFTSRTGLKSEVTELRVSPKNDSSERGVLPELSAIAKLLQSPDFQDRWNKRLQSLSISLCRSCKFRRARSLNLIPLEGHQSRPMVGKDVRASEAPDSIPWVVHLWKFSQSTSTIMKTKLWYPVSEILLDIPNYKWGLVWSASKQKLRTVRTSKCSFQFQLNL